MRDARSRCSSDIIRLDADSFDHISKRVSDKRAILGFREEHPVIIVDRHPVA